MGIKSYFNNLFGGKKAQEPMRELPTNMAPPPPATRKKDPYILPDKGGRTSIPSDNGNNGILSNLDLKYKVVNHPFLVEIIPVIRALAYMNEDMSQALNNIVSLGNTGHKVFFDKTVPAEQVDKMRNHLENKKKNWAPGQAGMNGLVNKMFAQTMIGGALSNEWVPTLALDGIENVCLVNPEQIYAIRGDNGNYEFYQKPTSGYWNAKNILDLVKLNPQTYRYFALNGDTELPYGIPPYMSTLNRIRSQNNMIKNMDFVVDQLSLLGFLEILLDKPDTSVVSNDADYDAYLQNYLIQAKERMAEGIKDGIVIGFDGDHKFKFNSFSHDYNKALELFKNNEQLLASGLKQDLTLMGRDYNTSETQITVIFMKMLSELRNIQNIVKHNLEFGYALELRLAGFQFDYLKVQFNRSTIQDDLKYQQAEEIKIRNIKDKRLLGIIDQDTAADELGYETPAFPDPMVDWEVLAGVAPPNPGLATDGAKKKQDGEKKKDANDKKVRDKNKPVSKN